VADEERGWGLSSETFASMEMVARYGGPDWFRLGDRDLATHILRTEALRSGETLGVVTARLCRALGIASRVLPMADAPCRTLIDTLDERTLPFQEWFVARRAQPQVRAIRFEGQPKPGPGVLEAIDACELVLIGPSNPYVSIDPILSIDGVRDSLANKRVVAVSPIVRGRAVKGPLAAMISQLTGLDASAAAIARHYGSLLRGIVVQHDDEGEIAKIAVRATDTIMKTREDRLRLARETLAFAMEVSS
jgi:LPPG:FO 2-phospho-L-lactate transferase